ETHIERPRFAHDYTLGPASADLHMVAGALRLADILDFDRERTPAVLFHYLLPTNLAGQDNKSVLEWGKHLAISNWHIDDDAVVFRGHCYNHIVHHAIVQFCDEIEREIKSTFDTFTVRKVDVPFNLPRCVQQNIEQHDYTYVPYKFELDDNRVYELLMGGAIYDNPLVAVRELVQNAVDACKLKDALVRLHEPEHRPTTDNRITISYREPSEGCSLPTLTVTDTGTGMDEWIIEKYFLKVGQSYYNSQDFNKVRLRLQEKDEGLDFAPVSEFGIGFLSCFLVADRLEVTTAMWDQVRDDTRKRTLVIDGPTRLIRLTEDRNEGLGRFKGTAIKLYLTQGSGVDKKKPPTWAETEEYLRDICQDLPYRLNLEHISSDGEVTQSHIDRLPLVAKVPRELESMVLRIPVDDAESGLEGEIALFDNNMYDERLRKLAKQSLISVRKDEIGYNSQSILLRGGFKIGDIKGLPDCSARNLEDARLRLNWGAERNRRYRMPNLARNNPADSDILGNHVFRLWVTHLMSNIGTIPNSLVCGIEHRGFMGPYDYIWADLRNNWHWAQQYDALDFYNLAKKGWSHYLGDDGPDILRNWEDGKGNSLRVEREGSQILCNLLFHLMPRITGLEIAIEQNWPEYYVKPPQGEWQDTLRGWKGYLTNPPVQWVFADYPDNISNLLYVYNASVFNSNFRDRILTVFDNKELKELSYIFDRLVDTRKQWSYQAELDENDFSLFRKAREIVGDLEIGYVSKGESWRIDSFDIPEVAGS
ncbi:MAG: ATP-binding protein, partial [Planctomycetes bacterium]|nr:ATP-binding protein [Planctomycetota bacterium]